jgi:hypothetical protein
MNLEGFVLFLREFKLCKHRKWQKRKNLVQK